MFLSIPAFFIEHPLSIGISTSMLLSTAPQGKKGCVVASYLLKKPAITEKFVYCVKD
jgi:hypothetical protein